MTEQYSRSKIPLNKVYSPENLKNLDYDKDLNAPGDYPYTRGIRLDLFGRTGWIQRELSGEGEPSTSNEQLKYLISKGQSGIDVVADSPSMAFVDPDHPFATHSIGTQGVSICCLQDFRELWQDLPLDSITISNSIPAPFTVAALFMIAKENNIPPENLRGSVVNAPFFFEDCGYAVHMPINLRLRMACDSIEFCTRVMPKFHSFLEDTYFFSEAGLDAVEEMALGFIEIRHIVRELLKRGMDIDSFAPRIAILVNCSMDFSHPTSICQNDEGGIRGQRSAVIIGGHYLSYFRLVPHGPAAVQQYCQGCRSNIGPGVCRCAGLGDIDF
jgi:methylmalonyl-CoA mutase N-terminal domain/subunit